MPLLPLRGGTLTGGIDFSEGWWDTVSVTAIDDDHLRVEFYYAGDADPYNIHEILGANHLILGNIGLNGTFLFFTDEEGNSGEVHPDPGSFSLEVDTCALSDFDDYCNF